MQFKTPQDFTSHILGWPSSKIIAGGDVKWCSHHGQQYGGFSKKLKTE